MAISSKKISGFRELQTLSGDEYLMVAFNNRSYKVKTSLFTSDIIKSLEQKIVDGDEALNPITITTSGGQTYTFNVRNGKRGSKGEPGNKGEDGERGNAGIALYNTDFDDRVINKVDGTDNDGNLLNDEELTSYALSAMQGYVLNNKLDSLAEEYITQEEYDERVRLDRISANTKYFIIDED